MCVRRVCLKFRVYRTKISLRSCSKNSGSYPELRTDLIRKWEMGLPTSSFLNSKLALGSTTGSHEGLSFGLSLKMGKTRVSCIFRRYWASQSATSSSRQEAQCFSSRNFTVKSFWNLIIWVRLSSSSDSFNCITFHHCWYQLRIKFSSLLLTVSTSHWMLEPGAENMLRINSVTLLSTMTYCCKDVEV